MPMSRTQTTGTTTYTTKHNNELSDSLLEAISVYTDKRKKPKRNRSAFILFSIDIRKKTQFKDLDNLNPNDKFVRIAELWKEAPEEERRHYEEKAKQEKERYTNELNDFCRIFPSEPIQRPRNHIKKPCNAYGYYLKDIKEEIRQKDPELRMCEVLRIVGEKWKSLKPEDKQKYEAKAEISRKQFKAEVSKQMETVKKVKVDTPSKTIMEEEKVIKVKTPEHAELTARDLFIPKFEAPEPEQPRLQRSTSTDKKNILANLLNSQKQQEVPQADNRVTPNSVMNLSLNNLGMSPVDLTALSLSLAGPNKNATFALQNLYWKVEGLRQHILLQLQSAMSGNQNLAQALFDQRNHEAMSQSVSYGSPAGDISMKEEFN